MTRTPTRLLLAGLAIFAVAHVSPALAAPTVEKAVRAALVMAESDSDPVPVIIEGWGSMGSIRELLGASAERDLPLINAVSGKVPAGKLRELMASDEIKAVYEDGKVDLIAPTNEFGPTSDIQLPSLLQILAAEEKQAGMTYGLRLINAPQAVQFVRKFRQLMASRLGQELPPIRIGVVDTGIDGHHAAFQGGILKSFSDLSYDFSPEARDDHGHGTHVAGTIAGGTSPDGIQIGVVPQDMAELVIARGLNPYGQDSWLISSLAWMADPDRDPSTPDGVQVINNSWGSSQRRPLYDRIVKALTQMGITVVFAAGNSGPGPGTVGSPGHLADVLTVGAVDHRKRVAPFSSRGDRIVNSAEIPVKPDVAAPGVGIYSIAPRNAYERWNGTSMAAPHVAGVVALMKAVNPGLSPRDVKLVLEETAEDLGPPGKDEDFGSGLVNALAACQMAVKLLGKTLEPDTPEALLQQAKDFMKERQTQYAVDNLFKVINAFPNLGLETRIEAGYLMGEAFRELGNLKGAMEAYKGVLMFNADSPFAPKAEYWMAWLHANVRGGNILAHQEEATNRFAAWLQKYPDHDWFALASLELARTFLQLNRKEEAKIAVMTLLEKRPTTEHRITAMQLLQSIEQSGSGLEF